MDNISSISIIVPTLNRADSLKLALKSFCLQKLLPNEFEILVIDNGSVDNTKEVCFSVINLFPAHQIRYIYEPVPGLLSGRHRGALESKGDILIFVDDDIEADVNWLSAIKETFNDSTVQIVGGPSIPNYEISPPEWLNWFWINNSRGRFYSELSLIDLGNNTHEIDADFVWGLNFSIRKNALFELDGFHPDCIPKSLQHFQGDGETGLTCKAKLKKYRTIYQPLARVFHIVSKERMTFEYFEKRYYYQGICDSYTKTRKNNCLPSNTNIIMKIKHAYKLIKQFARGFSVLKSYGIIKYFNFVSLKIRFGRSYKAGYHFHQKCVCDNPDLLDWILKKDYWEYNLPSFKISTH
jgi:glucosyl-dolichyl phosphate glucuronosyltransferase